MNDIIIRINTSDGIAQCRDKIIGIKHANLQNKLIFEMSEKIEGIAWLEYEINGTKNYAEMEETDNGYQIDIKSCLLTSDYVNVDLKITEDENPKGIPIFISTITELEVYDSINATEEEPEQYPDWLSIANSKIAEMNQLKEDVTDALEEVNNLDIDVNKVDKTTTIELTKKDRTKKTIRINDGISLQFIWNGTFLGIKTENMQEYQFVNLEGPQGAEGATGKTGRGIVSITKISSEDNVDTYQINYTDGTHDQFTVTNGTTPDLTDYVKNTDYATNQTGGVIKYSPDSYGTNVYNGFLLASPKTYAQYQSAGNTIFIGKGTLENVLTARIGDINSVLDAINGEVI